MRILSRKTHESPREEVKDESQEMTTSEPVEQTREPQIGEPARVQSPVPSAPVEEELAEIEEEAAAEETEIRLKAADLLGPTRRDMQVIQPAKVEPEVPTELADVISFANQKGGVAKIGRASCRERV